MKNIDSARHHHKPHHCHRHHHKAPHQPSQRGDKPHAREVDHTQLSPEIGGSQGPSNAAHTSALAANFGSGQTPNWRESLPENFRAYVSERNPDADNNQAAGIVAMLMVRLRKQ